MFNTLIKERKKTKTKTKKKEENSYKNRESHALKTTLAHTHVVNNTQSGGTNTAAQHHQKSEKNCI